VATHFLVAYGPILTGTPQRSRARREALLRNALGFRNPTHYRLGRGERLPLQSVVQRGQALVEFADIASHRAGFDGNEIDEKN